MTYPGGNADGSLLYYGDSGPVDSLRWETTRDGIEDYDYLALLTNLVREEQQARERPELCREARRLLEVSDVTRSIATPYETIRRTKFTADAKRLAEIVSKEGVGGLVIGLPLNLDGSEGPRAQSTRAFARNLAAHVDLPMTFWDERLSTAAVERHLIEADASRKRRAEVVDRMAAAYILQGALDRLRGLAAAQH